MTKVATIFFGSGKFAALILAGLLDSELVDVKAVITQTDKPAGRKQQLQTSPVKSFLLAQKSTVTIEQPEKLSVVAQDILDRYQPELIIVADYGQILPANIISYPKYKALNLHGSILPDMRGAVPIPMAILRGYKKTGVTIPVMTPGLDDGPIIAMREVEIAKDDTTATLTAKLAQIGSQLLLEILPKWLNGGIQPVEQDHNKATFVGKELLAKDQAYFDSNTPVTQLERMVRAFSPWPVAWTKLHLNGQQKIFKIYRASIPKTTINAEVGTLSKQGKELILTLRDGQIKLEEVQLEGKQRLASGMYLFLNGAKLLN